MFSQVADGSPPVRDCDSELRVRENKREWEQTGTTCKSREATEDRREKSSRRRLRRRRALHSGQLSRCQLPGLLWWWPFSTDGHATASVSIGCIACQRTLPPTSLSVSQSVGATVHLEHYEVAVYHRRPLDKVRDTLQAQASPLRSTLCGPSLRPC